MPATPLHKWREIEDAFARFKRIAEDAPVGVLFVEFLPDGSDMAISGPILPDDPASVKTYWRMLAQYAQRRADADDQPG